MKAHHATITALDFETTGAVPGPPDEPWQIAPLHTFGPWIDTLALARRVRPDLTSHALADVCNALDLTPRLQELCPGRDWHDALYDAFACALICEYCLALPGWEQVSLAALASI